ncbi:CIA30 family protein [Aliiglaciecola sp. LCG003]|uniref:CIA30 family protein n=1 Tax=Aliiglaciecola sp. LCG003 TaxID=3053655 RepID=UPI002573AD77|nr:CIA30 family protein [Aliiglaciecola sp. LCG003]WJG10322.1 CIA30 family protein [Aliiglaciecola sp. LCG003]
MNKLSLGIASLVSVFSCFNAQAIDLRVDNIRLYQSQSQSFSQPSTLYIDDGKITEIASSSAKSKNADAIVDANNNYAIPGLIDLHVHLGASGSNYGKAFQYLPVTSHFNSNLYLGVTNIVDLFSVDQTLNEAKQLAQSTLSPNFFYAGALFTNPGGHGTQFGGSALEVTDDAAIERLWQQHMARNPHVTKAVIETFGGHGASLTDNQLSELGKRSKAAGLPYFIHVSTLADGKRAIRAGATALAHGINIELIDDEFIELMVKHKVAYIPTLAVYHNHSAEKASQAVSSDSALLEAVPQKLKGCLFDEVPPPPKWKDIAWQNRQLAYQNIRLLSQAGIVIGAGSDAGNPYTLHGTALHNEIQALHESGLTPAQVINAATVDAAKIIQQSDIGQLKKGFEASFILLERDPIKDLSQLKNIHGVYKSGKLVNRERLVEQNKAVTPYGEACNAEEVVGLKSAKVIDDFADEIQWQEISDSMMGGQSKASISKQDKVLTITTHLGKPGGFGAWAGGQLLFDNPVDASRFKGVKITYRGSKIPFGISVYHSDVVDWDHFSSTLAPSQEWRTLEVHFDQLKQFGFGSPIQWSANKLTGISFVWRTMSGQEIASNANSLEISEISYF